MTAVGLLSLADHLPDPVSGHQTSQAERYRVLEHFYRLDPDLIARFYAGRSTLADRMKILSGRPPVPVGKALKAMWA